MSPSPPKRPTVLGALNQGARTVQAMVNFSRVQLKPKARVPSLSVQEPETRQPKVYPLLGDRYLVGRSPQSCEIVLQNPVVSQIHLSLHRKGQHRGDPFVLRDENSTNGVYLGRRRIRSLELRHGDRITLGPPELAQSVRLHYLDPPPLPRRVLGYLAYGAGGVMALILVAVLLAWQQFSVVPLPTTPQGPVVIYSADGQTPLRPLRTAAHQQFARLSDFSPFLPHAVIASEDSRFYWHMGVDPVGILRALFTDVGKGQIQQGASTITQQLARNLYRNYVGTQESLGRKFREAAVALKLEAFYGKDFLLLTYLNQVYLGNGIYGFADAAQYYFGKSARDLDLSEAATLAGILPAPSLFNPVQSYQSAVEYRDRVLRRMGEMGMASPEQVHRALRSRININPQIRQELSSTSTIAPYFYDYVLGGLGDLLGKELAQEGGFIVKTSLDPHLQALAEKTLAKILSQASPLVTQGAILTLNTSTGSIMAMVGGLDYQKSQFNRATEALRQPGSTFKLFTYTPALEAGISPETTYSCAPLTWDGEVFGGCERSQGYDNMYVGVAQSENVIALRIARQIGLDRVVATARRLGITTPLDPVPGLVIGQSEVTLIEMTGAYATVANNGIYNRPHAVDQILDSSDCQNPKQPQTCRLIYDYSQDGGGNQRLIRSDITQTLDQLFQGVVAYGTGVAANLGISGEAGKTGTTNRGRDLLFIGYLPEQHVITGIWLGNDDDSPTHNSSNLAAQAWGEYMGQAFQ